MTSRDRLGGAFAALGVQALLGWLLVSGLAVSWRTLPTQALAVFRVAPPPPPPPPNEPPAPERRAERLKDAAAPPNLKSRATPVVAPPPVLPPRLPPPVVAALAPASGSQATSGAALVAGPGTGAGGTGGRTGGGGDGDGGTTPPRQVRGDIKDSDYPPAPFRQSIGGTVDVRYLVETNGRVARCDLVRSSGNADLDETTCRVIRQRFRFKPARDASGHPVAAWVDDGVEWIPHLAPPAGG